MQIGGFRTSYYPTSPPQVQNPPAVEVAPVQAGLAAPVDRIEISAAALESSRTEITTVTETTLTTDVQECADCAAGTCKTCGDKEDDAELSEEEQAQIKELKERDTEVRAHEAAHASTGGRYAGSPSFEYEVGPDGKRYAVGGEVSIDTSPIDGNPQATIDKLRQVEAAALAPAEPSDQDRKVAQQAAAARRQAEAELSSQKQDELLGRTESATDTANPTDPSEEEKTDSAPFGQQQVQQAASAYEKVAALV